MGLGSSLTVLLFSWKMSSALDQVINAGCDSILSFNQIESKRKGVEGCNMHRYSDGDVVKCLDEIPRHVTDDALKLNRTKLYFLFVGDSRTRSHFTSFIRSFPDYDFLWSEFHFTGAFHSDVDVDSEILNIRISFRWRPLLSEPVAQELGKLSFQTPTPVFVLIGNFISHDLKEF